MTSERFDDLLGLLLEDELSGVEAGELALMIRTDPARRRELREHLVLWELWAQQQAPERSAEAFVAACTTRLRAERHGEGFIADLKQRMLRESAPEPRRERVVRNAGKIPGAVAGLVRALLRPAGVAWTAASAAVLAVVCWVAIPRAAQATTLVHGEAVCTTCILHETHGVHRPAIRVREGDAVRTYYVQSDSEPILRLGDFCAAPVPLVAKGTTAIRDGRHSIDIQTLESAPAQSPRPDRPDEPVLFPF